MAWAFFTAYGSIVTLAFLQLQTLKLGAPLRLLRTGETVELVKTALPDFADLLVEHGTTALPELLPVLEERLLVELQASAAGRDSDPQGVERARKVAELAAKQDVDRLKEDAGLLKRGARE